MVIDLFYLMNSRGKKKILKPPFDSEKTLKQLGERIKELRVKKGYKSYEYFAYDHEISRAQFGRYENGQDLRFSSLLKVINALGISLEDFFSEGFD